MSSGLYTCSTNSHGSGHSHPHNPPVVVCVLPTSPNQTDDSLSYGSPRIANLEEAFNRDYPITSRKDGRRERPLTGMISRLLTEGSIQKGELFEVFHLKITLGCFTRARSEKGRRQVLSSLQRTSVCPWGQGCAPPSTLVTFCLLSVFALLYPS